MRRIPSIISPRSSDLGGRRTGLQLIASAVRLQMGWKKGGKTGISAVLYLILFSGGGGRRKGKKGDAGGRDFSCKLVAVEKGRAADVF